MSEKIAPGPVGGSCFREAVCIHTNKVYDSCKSKECIRDLRVYLTAESQQFINNNCVSVKPRAAELLFVNIDVEKVPYKQVPHSPCSLCLRAAGSFSLPVPPLKLLNSSMPAVLRRICRICRGFHRTDFGVLPQKTLFRGFRPQKPFLFSPNFDIMKDRKDSKGELCFGTE